MRRFALFAIVTCLVVAAGLALVRGRGISAVGHKPLPFEAQTATMAWRFLVPAPVRTAPNPVPATDDVIKEAREHWADHCAICHDNDGSGETTIGRRVFPPVPDMRSARTQALTDGELFYAIEQGIPWTAMPGWATGLPDGARASWALVRFIRHLPSITPAEIESMEKLNPKPPPDEKREQEIEDFLNPKPAMPAKPGGRGSH